jgi:hypothetical protein
MAAMLWEALEQIRRYSLMLVLHPYLTLPACIAHIDIVVSYRVRNIFQVELLKEKFGFDAAFNYKEEPDLTAALKRSDFLQGKTIQN